MAIDHLADALNTIKTHEIAGQSVCRVVANKLIARALELLMSHKYIEGFEHVSDGRGGYYNIKLAGRINDCGVIKPRTPVKRTEWAKQEQQYIPAFGVGLLIVSTSQGVMSNVDAEKRRIGGRLVAYVY